MIFREIPDLSELREIKDQYREYPIDDRHSLYTEEVVPVSEFGIAGQSYYSQPNKMTGEPLPGVNPEALVRYSVAERLEAANREIKTSRDITNLLGGKVEIVVRDALRSRELQRHLFETVWPKVLKQANPDWDEEKIGEELPNFIAKPKPGTEAPTPHMTGGAVDLNLRYQEGKLVDFGHQGGSQKSLTDYYEGYGADNHLLSEDNAQIARRILYWTMEDQEFANNPTEWWHYSYGDQMWAMFRGEPAAVYGAVEQAPDLLEET
jgi:D-alanyl-D-alanine dipeptidase